MDPALPPPLRTAIEAMTQGRSGRELGARSTEISRLYRAHAASSRAVTSEDDALAYALTRMPATYAAVVAALEALDERAHDFAPRSLLDAGCGPGTAAWAAAAMFDTLETIRLVDASRPFLDLAKRLCVKSEDPALCNAQSRLGDLASLEGSADLVTVAYALTELTRERAVLAAERLWAACDGVLVIVEPGTPDAWARLMDVRAMLIAQGALVLAPCPHHAPCPLSPPDWCHFSRRLPRSRAHIAAKSASAPFEDEKFAYLVVTRAHLAASQPRPRVLAPLAEDKASMMLKLCSLEGAVEYRRVGKRDKAAFKLLRKTRWGDTV